MRQTLIRTAVIVVGLGLGWNATSYADKHRHVIPRDASYEEFLRVRANPDEKITPIRVIRWIQGMRGARVAAPAATEFQPIVDANEHRVQVIASLSFKFF